MSSPSFRILTLNVWSHYLVRAPCRQTRLDKIVEWIKKQDYDVLCIQELFLLKLTIYSRSSELDNFVTSLQEHGYIHHTDPKASLPSFFGQNSGLIILSKLPFTSTTSAIFDTASITEYSNNKGFITATIQVTPNQNICVCTAHLDAHSDARLSQLKQIGTFLKEGPFKQHTPIVVLGDLNICPRSTPKHYEALKNELNDIHIVDIVDKDLVTHIYGATLDHIFISKDLLSSNFVSKYLEDDNAKMLSDHHAVGVTITIPL